jgi:hypothetical protein
MVMQPTPKATPKPIKPKSQPAEKARESTPAPDSGLRLPHCYSLTRDQPADYERGCAAQLPTGARDPVTGHPWPWGIDRA